MREQQDAFLKHFRETQNGLGCKGTQNSFQSPVMGSVTPQSLNSRVKTKILLLWIDAKEKIPIRYDQEVKST